MSIIASAAIATAVPVAAAAPAAELTGLALLKVTAKEVLTSAPAHVFINAGLFVGVTLASAYVLIHRFKKMKKAKEEAEMEEMGTGSPLLFEQENITAAERALGTDNFVSQEDAMETLDKTMAKLRGKSRMCSDAARPVSRTPEYHTGGKKKKKKKKKGSKPASRHIIDDYNAGTEVKAAGRAELQRWYDLFGSIAGLEPMADDAARNLGFDD